MPKLISQRQTKIGFDEVLKKNSDRSGNVIAEYWLYYWCSNYFLQHYGHIHVVQKSMCIDKIDKEHRLLIKKIKRYRFSECYIKKRFPDESD